ncbi:MAG: hypothetical protein MUO26_02805 [Methanotrichaceae archaeon]|nr:hypothetical protein [Methanotrichaceae archaeon]
MGATSWIYWTPGSYSYNYRDNVNTHTWAYLSGNVGAITKIWYSSASYVRGRDGYYYWRELESDTWYNKIKAGRFSPYYWDSRAYTSLDVRTIATHEQGPTYGLGDLYSSGYWDRVMYYTNWGNSNWYLKSGDITGFRRLYFY